MRAPAAGGLMATLWRFRGYGMPQRRLLAAGLLCRVGELLADLAVPWPIALVIDGVLRHADLDGFQERIVKGLGGTGVELLVVAALASLVFTLASGAMDYLGDRLMNSAGERITASIRSDVFTHLLRLPMTFHDHRSVGELTSRMSSDTSRIEDSLVDIFSTLLPGVLTIGGLAAVITALDWRLGLIALGAAPLVFLAATRYSRLTREAARVRRTAEGRLAALTTETLTGIQAVQVAGSQTVHAREFADHNDAALTAGLRSVDLRARFTPMLEATSALGTAALLLVGGVGVLHEWWSPGVLIVTLTYFRNMLSPLRSLSKLSLTLTVGAASAERVAEILDEPGRRPVDVQPARLDPSVRFEGVWLTYGRGPVLIDVHLDVPAGTRLALSGPNGSGKSSILALVAGLYPPSKGRVLIGDTEVAALDENLLRREVSVVLQDTFLFSGSVFDNVLLGRPEAAPEDVVRASAAAGVLKFTDELPGGLGTQLGDRGVGLSGGQRQRVGIARALLRNSPIVLLDEPTSGLDRDAERALIDALDTLMTGRTVIMTTHRPALLDLADRTVPIRDGRLLAEEAPPPRQGTVSYLGDHQRIPESPAPGSGTDGLR
ncbi:MAG TPA: ABC transporter ATP-binding protein [Blastococcus sp.]